MGDASHVASFCPFCARLRGGEWLAEAREVVAFADGFPVAEGHALVVPRRHVARVGELTDTEWAELHQLGRATADRLMADGAEGVTYGVNDGAAAGQTVGHVHLHVIPRRAGDVPDPRGGVRWVLPDRAAYWGDE